MTRKPTTYERPGYDPFVEAAKLHALLGDMVPECPGPFKVHHYKRDPLRKVVSISVYCVECQYIQCKSHPDYSAPMPGRACDNENCARCSPVTCDTDRVTVASVLQEKQNQTANPFR